MVEAISYYSCGGYGSGLQKSPTLFPGHHLGEEEEYVGMAAHAVSHGMAWHESYRRWTCLIPTQAIIWTLIFECCVVTSRSTHPKRRVFKMDWTMGSTYADHSRHNSQHDTT